MQSKPEDGALSHGLGDKGGRSRESIPRLTQVRDAFVALPSSFVRARVLRYDHHLISVCSPGRGLPRFNASLRSGATTFRIVLVKRAAAGEAGGARRHGRGGRAPKT